MKHDFRHVPRPLVAAAVWLALLALPQLLLAVPASDPAEFFTSFRQVDGLGILTFHAPEGRITLNLPGELMGDDTVSATLSLEPLGRGQELERNRAALERYALRIDGEEVPARSHNLRWRIPAFATTALVELVGADGAAVTETEVATCPVEEEPVGSSSALEQPDRPPDPASRQRPADFKFQEMAQRGRTLVIHGPFDGDFSTTEVLIGGRRAEKLAESPHVLVVRNPAPAPGRTEVAVHEGDRVASATFCNFEIDIVAPAGVAPPGRTMPVAIRITGLDGMRRAFPLIVSNLRPEIAELRGGGGLRTFQRTVEPREIAADGSYTLELEAVVKRRGTLAIVAQVTSEAVAHTAGVTYPTHVADVSWPPPHVKKHTWEAHVTGVSFVPGGHKAGVTWKPHTTGVSWSPHDHKTGVTWAPHTASVSFPPPHMGGASWEPHTAGTSFSQPGHQSGVTNEPHKAGVTHSWQRHTTGVSWTPHSSGVTFPPRGSHASGTTWPTHQSGVSWPP
jgi:hypothetical protein